MEFYLTCDVCGIKIDYENFHFFTRSRHRAINDLHDTLCVIRCDSCNRDKKLEEILDVHR